MPSSHLTWCQLKEGFKERFIILEKVKTGWIVEKNVLQNEEVTGKKYMWLVKRMSLFLAQDE